MRSERASSSAVVAILSLSPIAGDGRVLREVRQAADDYQVHVVGWGPWSPPDDRVEFHPIRRVVLSPARRWVQLARMILGRAQPLFWDRWYWSKPDHRRTLDVLIDIGPRLIHANEAIALPLAVRAAEVTGAKLLFDAHEYSPDHWTDTPLLRPVVQPYYRGLLRRHLPRVDAMTTVAQGLADRFEAEFGVECQVIRNAPFYRAMPFRPTDRDRIELMHHGVAMRARQLERTIDVVAACDDRYRLSLMLVEHDAGYVEDLRRHAAATAPDRVTFRAPVPPAEIVPTVADADIGLALIPPHDFSYLMALPNKFFEFLMAGLAVVTGPSPEMARICREDGVGVVAEDHSAAAVAAVLNRLSAAEIDGMKRQALEAARRYNADAEMGRLGEIYAGLLRDD